MDTDLFRPCACELDSSCVGFVHPLDPHNNCYLCRGECGVYQCCDECKDWDNQRRKEYLNFLELLAGVLGVPGTPEDVSYDDGTSSSAAESPANVGGEAEPHPNVSIEQTSSSFEPLGSDAVDQVVLTVSNPEPFENSTSKTSESCLGSHGGSLANVVGDSATSLHVPNAGEVLNDSREPHNRTSRVLAIPEAAQLPFPQKSPSHGPHPSHATKMGQTMNHEGYPYHHPSPRTKVLGSEAASQPSMREQDGSSLPMDAPLQVGVSHPHQQSREAKVAPAGDLPGFPKLTPISLARHGGKTHGVLPQDLLRFFPSTAPLQGPSRDPRTFKHQQQAREDMHRGVMTNGLFNQTVASVLNGLRSEPHPSSGRWEKKDSASAKKGAALRRSRPLSSSGTTIGSSSSSSSSSGTPPPVWQPREEPASTTDPSSSRGPRLDGFPPHHPVRGGGVGANSGTLGREVPGYPNGPRPGGNPVDLRGNVGKPRMFPVPAEPVGSLFPRSSPISMEEKPMERPEEPLPLDLRVDFRSIIEFIRRVHVIETPVLPNPRRDVPLLEARVNQAPQGASTPNTLPMSASTRNKFAQINEDVKRIPSVGPKSKSLLQPRAAGQQKFYDYADEWVGAPDFSDPLLNFSKRTMKSLQSDRVGFSYNESKDMVENLAKIVSAASWMEWALSALGNFIPSLPADQQNAFQEMGVSISRANSYVLDLAATSWANWDLRRRDTALDSLYGRPARDQAHSLRTSPLFSARLFSDEALADAIEARRLAEKDDLVTSRLEPPKKKQRMAYPRFHLQQARFPGAFPSQGPREHPWNSHNARQEGPSSSSSNFRRDQQRRNHSKKKSQSSKKRGHRKQ